MKNSVKYKYLENPNKVFVSLLFPSLLMLPVTDERLYSDPSDLM